VNREQIIKMARQCADQVVRNLEGRKQVIDLDLEEELVEEIMVEMTATIQDFAALVAAAEREECAKVANREAAALEELRQVWEEEPSMRPDEEWVSAMERNAVQSAECAAAIRARGE